MSVRDLYGPFSNLASIYGIASDEVAPLQNPFDVGEPLRVLLEDHWGIFSEGLVDSGKDSRLLTAILRSGWDDDSGEPRFDPHELYVWRGEPQGRTLNTAWDHFREHILSDPDAEPDFPYDIEICTERVTYRVGAGTEVFRAVPGWQREDHGIKVPWAVGPPPIGKRISAGRANRQDERVAYCAAEEATAVAEVRPSKGNLVSVGVVRVLRDLWIVDLSESLPVPNPFVSEEAYWKIEETALLNGFSEDLSQPVRRNDDPREYLPTQKLAELLRSFGIDGIRYPSAMHPGGKNVVIFDPEAVEPVRSRVIEVKDLRLSYEG